MGILTSDEQYKRSSVIICQVVSILFDPWQDSINDSMYYLNEITKKLGTNYVWLWRLFPTSLYIDLESFSIADE